jgi:hypothetical protein
MGQRGHPQIRGLPSVIVPRLAALKRVNPVLAAGREANLSGPRLNRTTSRL